MRIALAFQAIRLVILIARELLALGYDKRQLKYQGVITKSRARISRAKFRRDEAIITFNDHFVALRNLRGLEGSQLEGVEKEMTIQDTYVAKSMDGLRQPLDSSRQDGQAHLFLHQHQTAMMGEGFTERGNKRVSDGQAPGTPSLHTRLDTVILTQCTGPSQPIKRTKSRTVNAQSESECMEFQTTLTVSKEKKPARGDGWPYRIMERGKLDDEEVDAWETDGTFGSLPMYSF